MKVLVIYPGKDVEQDASFHLLDPETGEHLASHLCSGYWYAKSDLHDRREDRKLAWKEKFGEETEAKFIEETEYSWNEVYKKNKTFDHNKEEKDA